MESFDSRAPSFSNCKNYTTTEFIIQLINTSKYSEPLLIIRFILPKFSLKEGIISGPQPLLSCGNPHVRCSLLRSFTFFSVVPEHRDPPVRPVVHISISYPGKAVSIRQVFRCSRDQLINNHISCPAVNIIV